MSCVLSDAIDPAGCSDDNGNSSNSGSRRLLKESNENRLHPLVAKLALPPGLLQGGDDDGEELVSL